MALGLAPALGLAVAQAAALALERAPRLALDLPLGRLQCRSRPFAWRLASTGRSTTVGLVS